jgi:hypothetical protein
MSLFSWFTDMFSSGIESPSLTDDASGPFGASSFDDFAVNPANGLPMIGGTGGVDIEGNPFGTDFSHDYMTSSSFDDSWSFSSGFDDS